MFPREVSEPNRVSASTMVLMGAVHSCCTYPPGCPAPRLQKSGPRTMGSTVIHSSIFWAPEQETEGLFDPNVQVYVGLWQ